MECGPGSLTLKVSQHSGTNPMIPNDLWMTERSVADTLDCFLSQDIRAAFAASSPTPEKVVQWRAYLDGQLDSREALVDLQTCQIYLIALSCPGASAVALFDALFFEKLMSRLAGAATDPTSELRTQQFPQTVGALREFLASFSMDMFEMSFASVIDAVVALTGSPAASDTLLQLEGAVSNMLQQRHGPPLASARMYLRGLKRKILTTSVAKSCRRIVQRLVCRIARKHPECRSAIVALLHHLCAAVPDKADIRAAVAVDIAHIWSALPAAERRAFVFFLQRFGSAKKSAFRAFAMDVSWRLLADHTTWFAREELNQPTAALPESPARGSGSTAPSTEGGYTPERTRDGGAAAVKYSARTVYTPDADVSVLGGVTSPGRTARTPGSAMSSDSTLDAALHDSRPSVAVLVALCVRRMRDRVAAVRTRALNFIGQLLELASQDMPPAFASVVIMMLTDVAPTSTPSDAAGISDNSPLAKLQAFVTYLRHRTADAKLHVRRAAVHCLTALLVVAQHLADVDWNGSDNETLFGAALRPYAAVHSQRMWSLWQTGAGAVQAFQSIAAMGNDDSVLMRRTTVGAVSEVFPRYQTHRCMQLLWLAAVLPMCRDAETTVAMKACDALVTHLIAALSRRRRGGVMERAKQLSFEVAWECMGVVAGSAELMECVRQALRLRHQQGGESILPLLEVMHETLVEALPPAACTPYWSLVDALTDVLGVPMETYSQAMTHLTAAMEAMTAGAGVRDAANTYPTAAVTSMVRIVGRAMPSSASSGQRTLPPMVATVLRQCVAASVDDRAGGHVMDSGLVSEALRLLAAATVVDGAAGNATEFRSWVMSTLETATGHLQRFTFGREHTNEVDGSFGGDGEAVWNSLVCASLHIAGELALVGLEAAERAKEMRQNRQATKTNTGAGSPSTIQLPLSSLLTKMVQSLISPAVDMGSANTSNMLDLTALTAATAAAWSVPSAVRAYAVLALGKLCLRDEQLGKESVPILVRLLVDAGTDDMIKTNVLVVVSDLCMRYASIIDPFLPAIASTVTHASPRVQLSAIGTLAQLVMADYLKLRGPLFMRLAIAAAANNETVALASRQAIAGLIERHPNLIPANFLDLLFTLNQSTQRPSLNITLEKSHHAEAAMGASTATQHVHDDTLAVTAAPRRMAIYEALLQPLPDEQRFTIAARLTQDVLGAAASGSLKLLPSSGSGDAEQCAAERAVVADTLRLLSLPMLRPCARGGAKGAAAAAEDPDAEVAEIGSSSTAAEVARAKRAVVMKLAKRHALEHMVPVCLAMKQLLQQQRSSLMSVFMPWMLSVFQDYSDAKTELLAGDPTLARELDFDLRQYERSVREQARRTQKRVSSPAVSTATPAEADHVMLTPTGAGVSANQEPRTQALSHRKGHSARRVGGPITPIRNANRFGTPKGALAATEALSARGKMSSCSKPRVMRRRLSSPANKENTASSLSASKLRSHPAERTVVGEAASPVIHMRLESAGADGAEGAQWGVAAPDTQALAHTDDECSDDGGVAPVQRSVLLGLSGQM